MFDLFRLARGGVVLARAGLFGFADQSAMPPGLARVVGILARFERGDPDDGLRGERLSAALSRLGPAYVKFGQFLATRPDLVGAETAAGLSVLKDDMAPFPVEEAKAMIAASLGRETDVLFEQFSDSVAAASIAQVHQAVVADENGTSRNVAVKVLRPDARRRFGKDLKAFYAGARFVERILPDSRRLKPLAVVETLERSVTMEMDLRLEAAALSEMAEQTAEDQDFRVPAVEWPLTGRDVLTTQWVDGVRLTDLDAVNASGLDRQDLARSVMQSFLRHALRDGFFHADMHEGNLFADPDGTIIAVDLGIVGRLGLKERRFLAEILFGFIRRDYARIAQVHFDAGYVPSRHGVEDFAQALRAIGEPIHGHKASDISMAKLLQLLFEITEIFDMQTRPELLLLQKTMVVVEGVSRRLDENFDMWSTADPVVTEWVERHLGPGGRLEDAVEGLASLGQVAGRLPELAERAQMLIAGLDSQADGGLRLNAESAEAIGAANAARSRSGRMALWIIAIATVVLVLTVL